MTKKLVPPQPVVAQTAKQVATSPSVPYDALMQFHRDFPNVDRSMIRPLYVRIEPGSVNDAPAVELDEISRRYHEALAQCIASRYAHFTPEQMEMAEALGFGVGPRK